MNNRHTFSWSSHSIDKWTRLLGRPVSFEFEHREVNTEKKYKVENQGKETRTARYKKGIVVPRKLVVDSWPRQRLSIL